MPETNPVVVALNAQIRASIAGGVESSVLSIVRNLGENDYGVRLELLAIPAFADELREYAGGAHRVTPWPFIQPPPAFAVPKGLRAKLRQLARGARDWLRRILRASAAPPRVGKAAEIDAFLCGLGVSVVHFPFPLKFDTDLPYVFEPHDIQHRHFPEFFSAQELQWREAAYGEGCRHAALVVCGTHWTKRDIMRQFGMPSERIAVIPRSSVNVDSSASASGAGRLRELGIPERFAYYPAMTFPHKNHLRLLQAIARLRDSDGLRITLVCTGRKYAPYHEKIIQAIGDLGLEQQVHMLETVPRKTLSMLFRHARYVVFPSLFEGLSQSLLEALATGCAIAGSTQSSIPETVGSAGLLFDATDVAAIAAAMRTLETSDEARAKLAAMAMREFERFSWARAAPMFAACYKKVAGSALSAQERALFEQATA